jgi:hypothetical protein
VTTFRRDPGFSDAADFEAIQAHDELMRADQNLPRVVREVVQLARQEPGDLLATLHRHGGPTWSDEMVEQLAFELVWDRNAVAVCELLRAIPALAPVREHGPKGRLLFHVLCREGHSRLAAHLAREFGLLNELSGDRNSLLAYAGATNDRELFYDLVGVGCEPFIQNKHRHTPMHKLLTSPWVEGSTPFVSVRLRFEARGCHNAPEEEWVVAAAVTNERGGVAPLCASCTVQGHPHRPLLKPALRLPAVSPELGQALLRTILAYAGVSDPTDPTILASAGGSGRTRTFFRGGFAGHSHEETKRLPALRASSWSCFWCRKALIKREYVYPRFGDDSDDDQHDDSDGHVDVGTHMAEDA